MRAYWKCVICPSRAGQEFICLTRTNKMKQSSQHGETARKSKEIEKNLQCWFTERGTAHILNGHVVSAALYLISCIYDTVLILVS